MGTLSYASPEQLAGHELSGATDVYSLGIVAYECLAGRPPFPGNDPAAVITAHMTGQPAPLPPDVPQPVAQIVMRCLAKDPNQRFGSAAELAQACRTGRPGSGTTAILPPASPPTDATRPMAHGAVPASSQPPTQAMSQGDASPPRGPDLPPPRDFEEPKRSKAVPITLTVLGVLVLVIAIVLWRPWEGDTETPDADGTDRPSASDAVSEDPATEEEADGGEEEPDSSEEDQGEDTSNDGGSDEETAEEPEEPTSGEVPDVRGVPVTDARESLRQAGFSNVTPVSMAEGGTEPPADEELCTVTEQEPVGNDYDYETEIKVWYWPDESNCGL
jgi:hypothetical protein